MTYLSLTGSPSVFSFHHSLSSPDLWGSKAEKNSHLTTDLTCQACYNMNTLRYEPYDNHNSPRRWTLLLSPIYR